MALTNQVLVLVISALTSTVCGFRCYTTVNLDGAVTNPDGSTSLTYQAVVDQSTNQYSSCLSLDFASTGTAYQGMFVFTGTGRDGGGGSSCTCKQWDSTGGCNGLTKQEAIDKARDNWLVLMSAVSQDGNGDVRLTNWHCCEAALCNTGVGVEVTGRAVLPGTQSPSSPPPAGDGLFECYNTGNASDPVSDPKAGTSTVTYPRIVDTNGRTHRACVSLDVVGSATNGGQFSFTSSGKDGGGLGPCTCSEWEASGCLGKSKEQLIQEVYSFWTPVFRGLATTDSDAQVSITNWRCCESEFCNSDIGVKVVGREVAPGQRSPPPKALRNDPPPKSAPKSSPPPPVESLSPPPPSDKRTPPFPRPPGFTAKPFQAPSPPRPPPSKFKASPPPKGSSVGDKKKPPPKKKTSGKKKSSGKR